MEDLRARIMLYCDCGMLQKAALLLEHALATRRREELHWTDYYRFCWLLLHLAKYHEVLEFVRVYQEKEKHPVLELFLRNFEIIAMHRLQQDDTIQTIHKLRLLLAKSNLDYRETTELPAGWAPQLQNAIIEENLDEIEAELAHEKGDLAKYKELSPTKGMSLLDEARSQLNRQNYPHCLLLVQRCHQADCFVSRVA